MHRALNTNVIAKRQYNCVHVRACSDRAPRAHIFFTPELTQSLTLNRVLRDATMQVNGQGHVLCDSFQFRGILYLQNAGITALAKGMLMINPLMNGRTIELPESCVKVHAKMKCDLAYSLEIIGQTDKPKRAPELTASIYSVLRLRICYISDESRRRKLVAKLKRYVRTAKMHTREKLVREAFGLDSNVTFENNRFAPERIKIMRAEARATPLEELRCNRVAYAVPHMCSHVYLFGSQRLSRCGCRCLPDL